MPFSPSQVERKHGIFCILVPSTDTNWSLRSASTFEIPSNLYKESDTSLIQLSQVMGTAKSAYHTHEFSEQMDPEALLCKPETAL